MRVEIDVGNTRLKWRSLENGVVIGFGAILHEQLLSQGLSIRELSQASHLVVSSVADDNLRQAITSAAKQSNTDISITFISTASHMAGLNFVYEDVSRLGVDRCLAMVGAYLPNKEGVLVIDCGSAITADFVQSNGDHVGGFILPGIQMLKGALLSGTAKVFVKEATELSVEPGKSTEECVEHGRYFMVQSLVSGLIRTADGYGINNIVVTGGDGEMVAELVGIKDCYVPDLIFKGMQYVVPGEA